MKRIDSIKMPCNFYLANLSSVKGITTIYLSAAHFTGVYFHTIIIALIIQDYKEKKLSLKNNVVFTQQGCIYSRQNGLSLNMQE